MALMEWIKKARRTLDTRPDLAEAATLSPSSSSAASGTARGSGDVENLYDNHGEIARGGMGAILRVVDRTLQRTAAMKILEPMDGTKDDTRRAIFFDEAQITAQLDHPNICPVYAYGKDTVGTDWLTMKLVRGRTLSDLIHAPGYDPSDLRCIREALEVFLKVCDALSFAHARGVLHRDLKPENIMVGDFGQVYLMDWGVAKVFPVENPDRVKVSRTSPSATDAPGTVVGTLMYMAPEQARGEGASLDVRADVFGLGAILYEILTQIPPYYAQNVGDLVLMAQNAGWRPPQEVCGEDLALPAALCAVCETALQLKPEHRYADVASMKAAIEQFLVGGLSFPSKHFTVGDAIISEGEHGAEAFIIQRGFCRVYKYIGGEMRALADLGPGDVFGEAAVFADAPRMATVQAITDVTVQVVTKEVFTKDLGVASSMGAFVKALATRFVNVDRELRGVQDQLRAMTEENARLQSQLVAALEYRTHGASSPSSHLPPPQVMAAAAALPLPPPPGRAMSASSSSPPPPPAVETVAAPPAVEPASSSPPLAPSLAPSLSVPPSFSSSETWQTLPPPPPALVAAMARLWGTAGSPEDAARLIVAAATEAAMRLKS